MSNIALKVFWSNEPMPLNRKIDRAAINVPFGVLITHPTCLIKSVNGKVGDVVLNAADVGADAAGSAEAVQQNLNTEVDTLNSQLDSLLTDLNNLSGTVETKASAASVVQALSTKADLINGVIPAAQLPSFVDDVLEYESWNQFPSVGEAGKIYVDTTENKTWRWSGSTYVIIGGGGVALGETAATAYRGDRGKAAYDHSISQGNPHNATTSDIPEGNKLYFTEDRVLQAALIGLNTTNPAPVTATDALLAAIGKLQAQIDAQKVVWVDVKTIGTINTILLLTSGFFVAKGIHFFKAANIKKTLFYFNCAMLGGFGFLVLKSFEYYEKLQAGLHMDYNSFFRFYWLLTGFHFIHVLVGLVILLVITFSIRKKQTEASFEDIEASASFWHMCDLIWLLLFPILCLFVFYY